MTSVAIIQARTNSSRLPGKVLLPINGIPIVILAAKRAANKGCEVIVATSTSSYDDGLAKLIVEHGICCARGSLENTLQRFVGALDGYADETLVFRLTSDNVFPDGEIIERMETDFISRGLEYMACNGVPSGVPYGMSIEVTRLSHLREANRCAQSKYDQEHVTPFIIRKFGFSAFTDYRWLEQGHFRCTIDCLDDYIAVQAVFRDVVDPISESALLLCKRLVGLPFQPFANATVPKLVLGTAQFGFRYGIANSAGQPSYEECERLIKCAIVNGVPFLDTARGYGSSESVIGQSLRGGWSGRAKVISKLSALEVCPPDAPESVVNAFVDASVFESCTSLNRQSLDVYALHRAAHFTMWGGCVWKRLLQLQRDGIINRLGASVQSPNELEQVLEVDSIGYIQLPLNILDWRWERMVSRIVAAKQSRDLIVHARSALLQGLIPCEDAGKWRRANVNSHREVREWLRVQVELNQRRNIADLCIAFVMAQHWVDGIVVGMETYEQLLDNILLFNNLPLSASQLQVVGEFRPSLTESTLNPAQWRKEDAG